MSKEQKQAPQWERIELDYRAGPHNAPVGLSPPESCSGTDSPQPAGGAPCKL